MTAARVEHGGGVDRAMFGVEELSTRGGTATGVASGDQHPTIGQIGRAGPSSRTHETASRYGSVGETRLFLSPNPQPE